MRDGSMRVRFSCLKGVHVMMLASHCVHVAACCHSITNTIPHSFCCSTSCSLGLALVA